MLMHNNYNPHKFNNITYKDTALILGPRIVNVFTPRAVYFHSTRPRDVWLTNWNTRLSRAVNSWASAKIIVLVLVQLWKFQYHQHYKPWWKNNKIIAISDREILPLQPFLCLSICTGHESDHKASRLLIQLTHSVPR